MRVPTIVINDVLFLEPDAGKDARLCRARQPRPTESSEA
jgi:hypothetical protein